MTLYDIDCEIERLENEIDNICFSEHEDFLSYTDKMLQLIQLKEERNNKVK